MTKLLVGLLCANVRPQNTGRPKSIPFHNLPTAEILVFSGYTFNLEVTNA